MGFKTSGFPMATFNPMGFKSSGDRLKALKECGLLSLATPEIDKSQKSTRPAVQGETILGDGNTYIDTTIVPNQSTALRIWGNFNNLSTPSVNQRHGSRTGFETDSFAMGIDSGGTWYAEYGDNAIFGGAEDTNKHKWELYDGEYFVDDVKIGGTKGAIIGNPTNSIYLNATNNNGTTLFPANFNLDRCEIDHNGITYTLNTKPDGSEYQLVPSDGSAPIICQQYLQPATPTETNITQESMHDKYGYTVSKALGKNRDGGIYFNSYVNSSGALVNDSTAWRTDLIYIGEGIDFVVKGYYDTTPVYSPDFITIACYDANGVFISRDAFSLVGEATFTVPVNCIYVICSFFKALSDDSDVDLSYVRVQLELGTTPTTYESYKGYTYDQAGLLPISQGHLIPNYPNSRTSTGYVGGVHPMGQYQGRVRYNFSLVGDVFKLADNYNGMFIADDTGILHTNGTIKELSLATMLHVTNDQMFATEDKQEIGFFKTALTGDCLTKAITFFKQGEQLKDQNGDLLFDAQGNALFALKPWVTN